MFPHRLLFLAILRVAIFSIEVPEAKSITCLRRQPRAHNALSFGTEVLKMAPEELPELMTGGGFHFMFFIYWTGLLFHLIMETFFPFFPVHGNPVSSSFLQIFGMHTWITYAFQKFLECVRESQTNVFFTSQIRLSFFGTCLNHERIWILVWFCKVQFILLAY